MGQCDMDNSLYVKSVRIWDRINGYYAFLPAIRALQGDGALVFRKPVSFFVGENGIGKSTLIEAIAIKLGLNPEGGSRNFDFSTNDTHSDLCDRMWLSKSLEPPKDAFFLRAESFYNAATYIDTVEGLTTDCYGGRSLHAQSHGESFLTLVKERFFGNGIYLLDEPEAALSPMKILELMCYMKKLVDKNSQFIISTHSPLLMAFPGADVFQLSSSGVEPVRYSETEHFKLIRRFMSDPDSVIEGVLDGRYITAEKEKPDITAEECNDQEAMLTELEDLLRQRNISAGSRIRIYRMLERCAYNRLAFRALFHSVADKTDETGFLEEAERSLKRWLR